MPRITGEKMEVLSVRITKEMKRGLKEKAESRGIRVSDLVRWSIAAVVYPTEMEKRSVAQRLEELQVEMQSKEWWQRVCEYEKRQQAEE